MGPRTEGTLRLSTGLRTGYTEDGDPDGRPALLLVHAWAGSRREFSLLQPLLPAWVRSVAIDLRGHGDADKPPSGYDVPTVARDVVAAMDALDLPDVVLVGASSGGYVAQQVAVDAPARVTGLVLAGCPRDLQGRRAPFADDVDALTDPVDPAWVRRFLAGFTDVSRLPGWYVDLGVEDALRIPADVWRASLHGLGQAPPPTATGTISAPTLVVSGDRDELLAGQAAELAAAIPRARWVRYPDAGHVVLWDQPARLAADIAAFLLEVAPSGP
ncbi:alpha/beta fold hydrolase [Blastococcus sp. SYSU D00669]